MATLRAISGRKGKKEKFVLVYGASLHGSGEVVSVDDGAVVLQNGTSCHLPFQIIEGTRQQIRSRLLATVNALFDGADRALLEDLAPPIARSEGVGEAGC